VEEYTRWGIANFSLRDFDHGDYGGTLATFLSLFTIEIAPKVQFSVLCGNLW